MKEQLTWESHSSWVWKAPLKIIQSQALLRAGSAKSGCPGPWTSPMVVTPRHLWTTCSGAWLPSQCNQKRGFFTASVWSPTPCPVTDYPWEESVCLLYIEKVPKTFSSLLCTVPAWSASPHQQVFQTLDCGGPWLDSLESIHIMNWGAQKWTQPCRGGSDQLAKLC